MPTDKSDVPTPKIEQPPDPSPPESLGTALRQRVRQQEIMAELGVSALKRTPLQDLLDSAARMAAEGLDAEFCKILEYLTQENRLLLRAGVGWDPGLVGVASVGADLASPAGYALKTGKPVISNHLENEERFRTSDLLRDHNVRRAINVILQGDDSPFGVLEVDSQSEGEFSEADISFLQGAANILGMAIERQRYEQSLRTALEHQQVLMQEINHRIKNSLQLVGSMFNLQAGASKDPVLVQALQEAYGRVTAIARVHERLYRNTEVKTIDLTGYLGDVCQDLQGVTEENSIAFQAGEPIRISTDRAVVIALLVGEMVTNAAKHAYSAATPGPIFVHLALAGEDSVRVSVRDEGKGLPPDAELGREGLGMKMIDAFVKQSGATLEIRRPVVGTEFVVKVPLQ
jgi:two-component sensor histidine kinase/putative methionine-R-sulfoxide reductase with GAF domain